MTYDILGIGIGPFNLGLAALSADISRLTTCFIDEQPAFNWHPGLLLPGARLQVPFYADLVTLVQPTSRFSWFAFLQAAGRLFRFGVQDNPFPLRREYNEYGQWVAAQLPNLRWSRRCERVSYDESEEVYVVDVLDVKTGMRETFHAKHLVIGIGSEPFWPSCLHHVNKKGRLPAMDDPFTANNQPAKELIVDRQPPLIFHAADYLSHKPALSATKHITIIGSGQSAAEIFQDLLNELPVCPVSWITRSPRFFPMEATPAAFELSSPDYRDHFYNLPLAMKEFILAGQDALYKGINATLLTTIYHQLYERWLRTPSADTTLMPNCELVAVQSNPTIDQTNHRSAQLRQDPASLIKTNPQHPYQIACTFRHLETDQAFNHHTGALILATGYIPKPPTFLKPIAPRINYLPNGKFNVSRHYSITSDDTIFVQNADLHAHGFASADLSFGPYRNAVILNTILGYDYYRLEKHTTFQHFGPPSR